MSIRRDFPDIPPVWAAGILVAQAALSLWLPVVRFDTVWTDAVGWVAMGAGVGLAVWAAIWFRRKRTTIEPRDVPTALIVEGPYRISRNPIYSGAALFLFGAGLALGALSSVAAAALFPPIIARRFVRGEEAALRSAFGGEADRYIAATRRW